MCASPSRLRGRVGEGAATAPLRTTPAVRDLLSSPRFQGCEGEVSEGLSASPSEPPPQPSPASGRGNRVLCPTASAMDVSEHEEAEDGGREVAIDQVAPSALNAPNAAPGAKPCPIPSISSKSHVPHRSPIGLFRYQGGRR